MIRTNANAGESIGPALPRAAPPLLLLAAFFALGLAVALDPPGRFDHWTYDALMRHGSARLSRVMQVVTDLGSDKVAVPLMIAVVGWLAWRRAGRLAITVAAIWGAAKLSSGIAKAIFDRERPLPGRLLGGADGYSFPSGHTVTAVITYGLIAILLARHRRGLWRWLPIGLAIVTALAVAVSRVYLGVHYATDVIGGLLLGLAWMIVAVTLLPHTESGSNPAGMEPEPT